MAAGIPETQAEAQIDVFLQFIDTNMATKKSLGETEANLTRDIKEVEANLTRNIKALELNLSKEITIKMGIMAASTISILAALITFH